MTLAVVVQCFAKLDTLRQLLSSLARCDDVGNVDLILWQDGLSGRPEYSDHWQQVSNHLREFCGSSRLFNSVRLFQNGVNIGLYATCRRALDYAFARSDFAVFAEDDVVFSRDAIRWFLTCQEAGLLEHDDIWAIAGESIFFDAREKPLSTDAQARGALIARDSGLFDKYVKLNWVPSTCFASSRAKWSEFGATRGEINGDVKVCERCQAEGKYAIFPVVARGKDIGMLHELGHSLTIHREQMTAVKNTYLLADELLPEGPVAPYAVHPFEGDGGLLFRQTVLLETDL